ncbi:hypothetical protein CDD82_4362 [Ophiocordyceps australis]|uniref:DlpA domain-containing protein n=1 Tax=Ophiocordyceps australis TaxID=1399860 RepID=A0A2C5Z771_9HYPO|nr:hypothetical protein CDD82_4362 [Ophiocordyceps australis]
MSRLSDSVVAQLQQYTACDVSDALLKLNVPGAGFLADLHLYSPQRADAQPPACTVVAPVSTVLFAAKDEPRPTQPAANIAAGVHWADVTEPGSFVVMQQPDGQTNAICGGIMALRIKARGAKGIVVAGRVRDLSELRATELPIWAQATSTVGAGAASLPWAVQVPLLINKTPVCPGDVAVHDPANGFVVIPANHVAAVLDLLPKLVAADEQVKRHVEQGMSVAEAFKRFR